MARAPSPLAENFEPHTPVVDIGMPGMNGYQLARYFRAALHHAHLHLVAMTGFGREDLQAALTAGFDNRHVKPVRVAELEALLARSR